MYANFIHVLPYELKEAIAEMRAQFHPSMLDVKIECDMTGKKPIGGSERILIHDF